MANLRGFGANLPSWVRTTRPSASARPWPAPRFDFAEIRKSLQKRDVEDRYFVNFHSEAVYGEYALELYAPRNLLTSLQNADDPEMLSYEDVSIDPPRRSMNKTVNRIIQSRTPEGAINLVPFNVRLRTKLNATIHSTIGFAITSQVASEIVTVGNAIYDALISKPDICYHYFSKDVWEDTSPTEILTTIDIFLGACMPPIYATGIEKFQQSYQYKTHGQFIFAMLHYRLVSSNMKSTVNLRLLLLAISRCATSNDSERIALLATLYNWLVVRNCDSCIEKNLYFDMGYSNTIYDLRSHGSADYEAIMLTNVDAVYHTYECSPSRRRALSIIPRLTHSGISGQARLDKSTVLVTRPVAPPAEMYTEVCNMATCYCLIVKTLSDQITRAVRGASLGYDSLILDWFTEIYKSNGNLQLVDDYMSSILAMYEGIVPMRNALKNFFVILYFGMVPDKILSAVTAPTNYADVAGAMLNTEPINISGVLSYCFAPNVSIAIIQEFLKMNSRHEVLISLIQSRISDS